ncbi:MAG: hypothetical protein KAR00_02295 [Candidatus Pacebacteria bacterium]|nr:hypothetical protein [Candidatus Paceibacterota bacterium]
MVSDDSKINLVFVLVIVFLALAIAGFALWIFFFSPDETIPEEKSNDVVVSDISEVIVIPSTENLTTTQISCLEEKIGSDFELNILSGELSPEGVQVMVDECSEKGAASGLVPSLGTSVEYQLASPYEMIELLRVLFSKEENFAQ